MPAVANIRVNTQVPFPASVTGAGPVVVAKSSGSVWTVTLSLAPINAVIPPGTNWVTDYILVYDSIANGFLKMPLFNFTARPQRLVTASPITVQLYDSIINVNVSGSAVACTLPSAASRGGVPLAFKDVSGNFAAHNLTLTPAAGDTIDGASSLVLSTNYQYVNLMPANDGTTTGWSVET